MGAGLAFGQKVCWGTTSAVEDILQRIALIAEYKYGHESSLAKAFARELREFWSGKVIQLEEACPNVAILGELIEAARVSAIDSGEYFEVGVSWLKNSLREFTSGLLAASAIRTDGGDG